MNTFWILKQSCCTKMAHDQEILRTRFTHQPHEHYSVCESMCTNQLCDFIFVTWHIIFLLLTFSCCVLCRPSPWSSPALPYTQTCCLALLPLSQFSGFFLSFFLFTHPVIPALTYVTGAEIKEVLSACCHFSDLSLLWKNTHISSQTLFHCPFFCTFSSENFNLGVA